ncbi:hypothetical protein H8356DRAFT_1298304 [Neocallimastix lanati (nom. inval.)]|nr:hypothetical protein H8356DRAFT_1298304 [Neocallimastix sp. JGI-2020a]
MVTIGKAIKKRINIGAVTIKTKISHKNVQNTNTNNAGNQYSTSNTTPIIIADDNNKINDPSIGNDSKNTAVINNNNNNIPLDSTQIENTTNSYNDTFNIGSSSGNISTVDNNGDIDASPFNSITKISIISFTIFIIGIIACVYLKRRSSSRSYDFNENKQNNKTMNPSLNIVSTNGNTVTNPEGNGTCYTDQIKMDKKHQLLNNYQRYSSFLKLHKNSNKIIIK